MNTIEILKNVIDEQMQLTAITDIEIATIESIQPLSIKLSNDKILPKEFLSFTPKTVFLKNTNNNLELNTKILVLKKLGGQQYIIIDYLEDTTLGTTISTVVSVNPLKIQLANGKILEEQSLMIFSKELTYLRTTEEKEDVGKKLVTLRETGTGKFIFNAESEG